jgi:hypothetical protein
MNIGPPQEGLHESVGHLNTSHVTLRLKHWSASDRRQRPSLWRGCRSEHSGIGAKAGCTRSRCGASGCEIDFAVLTWDDLPPQIDGRTSRGRERMLPRTACSCLVPTPIDRHLLFRVAVARIVLIDRKDRVALVGPEEQLTRRRGLERRVVLRRRYRLSLRLPLIRERRNRGCRCFLASLGPWLKWPRTVGDFGDAPKVAFTGSTVFTMEPIGKWRPNTPPGPPKPC